MYIPAHFRQDDQAELQGFMRRHSFALLSMVRAGRIEAVHLPLLLRSSDTQGQSHEHGVLAGHLARANPIWQAFDGSSEALVVFSGAHAYVSPRWYASSPQVPTWNYMALHAYGAPRIIKDAAGAEEILRESTQKYEEEVSAGALGNSGGAAPWDFEASLSDVQRRLQYIVAFELPIRELQGCFKLNQHKKAGDRDGVIEGLEGQEDAASREVAALMRQYCPKEA